MKFRHFCLLYSVLLVGLTVFSYGMVDLNFPLKVPFYFDHKVPSHRLFSTVFFAFLVAGFFGLYAWTLRQIKKEKLSSKQIWPLIFLTSVVLLFSWPALSHDVFNYMATAKVAFFYQENPYLMMPIEFLGESMLKFMHAANKVALYAPFWIILTAVPHFFSFNNLVLGVFVFKAWVILFYLGLSWLIWKISDKKTFALALFALNPLVMIETLVSGHNDVVMMALAMLGFGWLFQKKRLLAWLALIASIGVKYATVVLCPLFLFASKLKKEKIITLAAWVLLVVFLLSPLREEIYPWYFIWIIPLVALVPQKRFLFWLTTGFSLGLLLRHLPWLYFRNWGGLTPTFKTLLTFTPVLISTAFGFLKRGQ